MLGEDPAANKPKELRLHSSLSARWKNYLSSDLKVEELDALLLKYPRSGVCNLEAPNLNAEIQAGLIESAVKRDKFFMTSQNVLGSALSALGEVITEMLNDPVERKEKIERIGKLGDIGKLLAHQHHAESVTRKAFISPGLSKEMRIVLEGANSDAFLFGNNLSEKIKEAKQIQQTSRELKNMPPQKKTLLKTSNSLNYKGPAVRQPPPAYQSAANVKPVARSSYPNYHPKNKRGTSYNRSQNRTQGTRTHQRHK